MKKFLLLICFLAGLAAQAQTYNNEWIDYSKTYYKFKVGRTGLYRLPGSLLASNGMGSTEAGHFQLWRHGVQVPIYTSVASGAIPGSGFIEFWGEMNDGKADKALYRQPGFQFNEMVSMVTDTATYFLTVNPAGGNLRLLPTANDVTSNTLTPEASFLYTAGLYFRDRQHDGVADNVSEYLYSSSYDAGEGFASGNITPAGPLVAALGNLHPAAGAPAAQMRIGVSGAAFFDRTYRVSVAGSEVLSASLSGGPVSQTGARRDTVAVPVALLGGANTTVQVANASTNGNDRIVTHYLEIDYQRQWNFGGASQFEFKLPARNTPAYLEIGGFNAGTSAPILYDLTNGARYTTVVSGSNIRVVLQPSASQRRLVLVSESTAPITAVAALQSRQFTNYALPAHAGDYLIISNPLLTTGTNPVEAYRAYRASAEGGGYNAKVYMVEDLVDQFAYGIKLNPLGIRNFIHFARNRFAAAPKHVLLLGKGMHYKQQRQHESNPVSAQLNLVPTFGWPASDILLAAPPQGLIPLTSIGRLSVINTAEAHVYLKKVKEFEAAQRLTSPRIADKAWMKNVVHIVGASDPGLQTLLDFHMEKYRRIIEDTLFGAKVTTFTKSSPNAVEQISTNQMGRLFEEGITLMTYFGHSSATTLEFNLNNPAEYNNPGKYPMFLALGCSAGDIFNFTSNRESLSEKYVLAPDRGTIGFVASTSFGLVHTLDIHNTRLYHSIAWKDYGKTMGELMVQSIVDMYASNPPTDMAIRAEAEQNTLHGDPAVRLNPHAKPDYVIEDPLLSVSPSFVSIADTAFTVAAKFLNIGRAPNRPIVLQVTRQYPDGTIAVVHRVTVPGIRFSDSLRIRLPIDPVRDKGTNRITVKVEADDVVDELYESNNTITREIVVFEDEIRPVYPYNYSIVNKQSIKLAGSTANALSASRTYQMEIDTTELFNSPLKKSASVTSTGGVIEFSPGLTFTDSTVYYWRVGNVSVSGTVQKWNEHSFVYIGSSPFGFNQSHHYQHLKSGADRMYLDTGSRSWRYKNIVNNLFVRNGVFGIATGQEADMVVSVNGNPYIRNICNFGITFNVFDAFTFAPWKNEVQGGGGLYGTIRPDCAPSRIWNFSFTNDTSGRRKALHFIRNVVPAGHYVVFRTIPRPGATEFVDSWMADAGVYGAGNTLYGELINQGVSSIDSFHRLRVVTAVYKKNGLSSFPVAQGASVNQFDVLQVSANPITLDSMGSIHSPPFGQARTWKKMYLMGRSQEGPSTDSAFVDLIGVRQNGSESILRPNVPADTYETDISSVSASEFPFLRMQLRSKDKVNFTPWQLNKWMLTYDPVPEGAIAPNLGFQMKDTFDVGEAVSIRIPFKNVSETAFLDSMRVEMRITDASNVPHFFNIPKHKILVAGDTVELKMPIVTQNFVGKNQLFVAFNPNREQPEQFDFNNFLFKSFFVRGDSIAPMLDVTFDQAHILNGDVVSSRPSILIKLRDNAQFQLLDDTSLMTVQVRFPDANGVLSASSQVRTYRFNSDTLRFIPATAGGSGNQASVEFNPAFFQDGTYELIVRGKDKSSNAAGSVAYRVNFQVINKAMISNLLNYPNPFTTSTAFVFTITGAEVPQNIRIQILTITGKIVREITKAELGTLRVGRNITEFKWDGTDQYGQALGNGVYLYRMITNHQGKSLEKYRASGDNTDQYFNKGYGKMYLMR